MAKLIKIVALLLIVLPALISGSSKSQGCEISVTTSSNNNQYTGTINNIGSASASNVLLTPSSSVSSVSGLNENNNGGYTLTSAKVSSGGIAAGASLTFTYRIHNGKTVRWTASCTSGASSSPTSVPATNAPTSAPATKAPTTGKSTTKAPTSAPATKASTTTTKAPSSAPATKASTTTTKAPTTAAAAGGRVCPSGTWWAPAPQTTWQWQLTGTIDTSFNVQMYDIDLFDNTAATMQTLHNQGRVVICYFSTQYENWRPDASSFTAAVIGNGLDGWAGENYVDIRSTVVRNIMTSRLDLALSKGCDGVEPDNVDGYENDSGFPLTAADQISFNSFIATEAHARGLSVGLKNDVDQATTLEPDFDWALDEQCNEYDECNTLYPFITNGKAVFNCEYSGSASTVCPKMVTAKFSTLFKTLDLTATINTQCCTYQSDDCAAVPYTCVSAVKSRNTVYDDNALEVKAQEAPTFDAAASASSFASIAFVLVAAVAALNL